ncbi:MAG: NAD(P)H-dependent oxidoreductase subunit E [Phycisphaeraceae bacterium]|nr:NAD(P)H-dependent oxidoreductase subunit E [Phycisphaeraceae bacterium]
MIDQPDPRAFVDQLVARCGRERDQVVPLLNAVQDQYRHLPAEALARISQVTDIHPSDLLGVATFYDRFRHRPAGAHAVRICHGTACHVRGSERLEEALRRDLRIPDGEDTDPDARFTVARVACVGCCSLAPVVQVDDLTLGHLDTRTVTAAVMRAEAEQQTLGWSDDSADIGKENGQCQVRIPLDSCCLVSGGGTLYRAVLDHLRRRRMPVGVRRVGCSGLCRHGPSMQVVEASGRTLSYAGIDTADVDSLLDRHFATGVLGRGRFWFGRALDWMIAGASEQTEHAHDPACREPDHARLEATQVRIATEHYGRLDPLDLPGYRSCDGFAAWRQVVEVANPAATIETIIASGLRGRGGGGYPTGRKWDTARRQDAGRKFAICNGDEGDPGAFMDRTLMESFPFRIIEGLAIAAHSIGARDGVFYIRQEYPLALRRIRRAIKLCQEAGIIGTGAMGGRVDLRLSVREGAGAFICGEETAMIASIEGRRGNPSLRPPYPVERGLWGAPTLVNNVETLANVPWIVRHGPAAFARFGTERSRGTKVFALAGKVRRGGLIEVPMGTTIHQVVYDIGGGIVDGRRFKAVQIGGPSGGCLPASLAHTPIDYEALTAAGAIMGSGGLVVLDDRDCIVDLARYFLEFTQNQSCGKCSFCRIGARRMHDMLMRICQGEGGHQDLDDLLALAGQVASGSLCGLGASAPNPVLTTMRYFRDEFLKHLEGRCPAGRCVDLIHYRVTDRCTGCTLCAQACPVEAIAMTPYQRHRIDDAVCTRCDACRQVCRDQAINVE